MTVKTLVVDAAVLQVVKDNIALFRTNDTHYSVSEDGALRIRAPGGVLEIAAAPDSATT